MKMTKRNTQTGFPSRDCFWIFCTYDNWYSSFGKMHSSVSQKTYTDVEWFKMGNNEEDELPVHLFLRCPKHATCKQELLSKLWPSVYKLSTDINNTVSVSELLI